ncbi:MAG: hypothetical protein ACI9JY_001638, partial [Saprospiraceae bacterium]
CHKCALLQFRCFCLSKGFLRDKNDFAKIVFVP